jgi:hypothetical protein
MKKILYIFAKDKKKIDTYNPMKSNPSIELGNYTIKETAKGKLKVEKGGNGGKEIVQVKGEYFEVSKENEKAFLIPTKPTYLFEVKANKKGKPDIGAICRGVKAYLKSLEDGLYIVWEDLTIEKLK